MTNYCKSEIYILSSFRIRERDNQRRLNKKTGLRDLDSFAESLEGKVIISIESYNIICYGTECVQFIVTIEPIYIVIFISYNIITFNSPPLLLHSV